MRAWEIENWTQKKLRCAYWADPFWIRLNPDTKKWEINWYTYTAEQMLIQLMDSDEVEEYKEQLPNKIHDLTWQEAYDAWKDGWEVSCDDDDRWFVNFEFNAQWSTLDIVQRKFHLTGKRR